MGEQQNLTNILSTVTQQCSDFTKKNHDKNHDRKDLYNMPTTYHIHELLNKFETYFKHKRLETHIDYIFDNSIYVRMIYKKNYKIKKTDINPKWLKETDAKELQEKQKPINCCIRLKLRITRSISTITSQPWHLRWDIDDIHADAFFCPDWELAKEFEHAKAAFQTQEKQKIYEVKINGKLLEQARQESKISIKRDYEDILAYSNTDASEYYNKCYYLRFLNTHLNLMRANLNTLQFLYLGPYGSGNEELDGYFMKDQSINHIVDNTYFAMYTKSIQNPSQTGAIMV